MKQEQQDALRAPFPKEQIQKLPTGGLQLDYVSHAWVTDRLLQVDPMWTWKPLAFTEAGLPAFDSNGGLWIELTVCGVTRYGYGEPQGRDKFDMTKGAIGNAIRNAAMRFGVALDLWAKEAPTENTKATPYAKSIPKATKDLSTATQKMIERINLSASLVELSQIVPLIQSGEFTDAEKRNLRIIFDNKKVELGA
jgi:hypothetical protein